MGPVSAQVEIDAPRRQAFELIGDLSRRPSFTDHFVSDFHLTRIESSGPGAGARFRLRVLPRAVWMDTVISVAEEPLRIVEHGCGGRGNGIASTTVWELLEGPGPLTRVRVSYWTEASHPLDRAIERFGGASIWHGRAWRRALRRMRDLLESTEGRSPRRVAVAGGNPRATGIP
jgi:Polyketide cyclase / dehydrase and lipid transport